MNHTDDVDDLKSLGEKETIYVHDGADPNLLEVFPNKYPENEYTIFFQTDEFTSLCPKTGQPDFARILIEYIPNESCIETKSLKLYLFSYRNYQGFMETITNKILTDLVKLCKPNVMTVRGEFNIRGGIRLTVQTDYSEEIDGDLDE